MENSIYFVE